MKIKIISLALLLLAGIAFAQAAKLGEPSWTYPYPPGEAVNDVDVTADGTVVGGANDGAVFLLSSSGRRRWITNLGDLEGKKISVLKVSITNDGSYVAAATSSRNVYLINGNDGSVAGRSPTAFSDPISDVAITEEGTAATHRIVAATWQEVRLYDLEMKQVGSFKKGLSFMSVDASSYGKFFTAATQGDGVYLFDETLLPKWEKSFNTLGVNTRFDQIGLSHDGERLLASSDEGYYYKIKNNKILNRAEGGDRLRTDVWAGSRAYAISAVDLSMSGKYGIIGGDSGDLIYFKQYYGGVIYFIDMDKSDGLIWKYNTPAWVSGVAVSQQGHYAVAASDRTIYFFDNSGSAEVPADAAAKPRIVVLANSIDYNLATEFFGFLRNNGIEVINTNAQDFERYKAERFIVILGGPDAYEGVGAIVQSPGLLTSEEQNYVRTKGNRKMFVKTNVWTQGQRVFIIAGSNRFHTQNAHLENRESVSTQTKAG